MRPPTARSLYDDLQLASTILLLLLHCRLIARDCRAAGAYRHQRLHRRVHRGRRGGCRLAAPAAFQHLARPTTPPPLGRAPTGRRPAVLPPAAAMGAVLVRPAGW